MSAGPPTPIDGAILDAGLDEALREELVAMTCQLVEIASPTGEEGPLAEYVAGRFAELGLEVERQEVEPGRDNVVARWPGEAQDGPSLLFNGHFDTGLSGREENLPFGLRPSPRIVDGEWIYGLGVSNMKVAFACYYGAIRLLQRAGLRPSGDLLVVGVVGETEKAPINQHAGRAFRAGGWGTIYAAYHGVLADSAIIGEPTGLRLQTGNSSYVFARVRTRGVSQHTWSKERGDDAMAKAVRVLEALRAWEPTFERNHPHPRMGSRIGFGGIAAGNAFQPAVNPPRVADLFLDLRFPPTASIRDVRRELSGFLADLRRNDPALATELRLYLCRNGYEIGDDEPVVGAIEAAHSDVFGEAPGRPERYRYDVSADTSILHEFGVPAVTYGPGGLRRDGGRSVYDEHGELVSIANLLACVRVYARAAARLTAATPA
ncbi:MAG TPA: M20/M25/M40 family metallo-hydrolase [Candidatus Limnocylindrales bacterium]|nr:M20/M25/M40 family metallo-hydrolase [Candidatus Limnocylindrales bacterium]